MECSHGGSCVRNSQVFSYCASSSLGTSGCAVSSREGEGVRQCRAGLCSLSPTLPSALSSQEIQQVSIEMAEAALKSPKNLGPSLNFNR